VAIFNQRDKSRTSPGKTRSLVIKHTRPPTSDEIGADGKQGWLWLTIQMLESPAYRTLSGNAMKAFARILIEHRAHGGFENGKLTVTHQDFIEYGVSRGYVGDAVDELEYKGLIRVKRGRSGAGTPHASIYTLTYVGDYEGAPPTNDWRNCTMERCKKWSDIDRKRAEEKRAKLGRKKKTPVRDSVILPVRDSVILKVS